MPFSSRPPTYAKQTLSTYYALHLALPESAHLDPTTAKVESMLTTIIDDHRVDGKYTNYNGKVWLRLSGSVFAKREDFARLKDAVLKMIKKN